MGQQDAGRTGPRLRVLQSFHRPKATTNPYVTQLLEGLRTGADVETYGSRQALLGRYDVLHVHWPEVVVTRSRWWARVVAAAVFWGALRRTVLTGAAVVRTVHNVTPHEPPDLLTRLVLAECDRRTTWWVRLNDETPTPPGAPVTTVLHGDYRAWFADVPRRSPVRGRLAYVGLVRPYKGVEDLVDVVAALPDPEVSLTVSGRPSTGEDLAAELRRRAHDDPRIALDLRHLDEAEIVGAVSAAELVVLPYRRMHNSGAALLALSLDRPVLVPRNAVTDALAAEVGERWVQRYDGDLDAAAVEKALAAVRADAGDGGPDLTQRGWDAIAAQHLDVYRAAVARRRGARRR
ncbi:hypothetical protein [Cellulomonas endophytica]|uniref:hypothetical protein n=1 Tax=Cellulomonas endophytica TaxID=2494735 RepID=UPI001012670C|nr:hypothetical protein [Cellulomonas endophytica]